ncbi:MAG: diaminopimelate epimerase [FCB group bacterium]|nr:diaminopimelate epimerase [FCB group bacterium]
MMIPFSKYHALGNNFIVLEKIQSRNDRKKFGLLAEKICAGPDGVGADGLMVIFDRGGSFHVEIFNADGSWAEKSGNGLRIAAMHLLRNKLISARSTELSTASGPSRITFHRGGVNRQIVSGSLGKPIFDAPDIPVKSKNRYFVNQKIDLGGRSFVASAVSVGNPHLILFCDDFDFDWESIGEQLEFNSMFPDRINVGFVIVRDNKNIEVRDWERGVGPTRSSGTGAAAAAAISIMRGFTGRKVDVLSPAGTLQVEWAVQTDEIIIKGPVEFVFSGEYLKR